jgi:sec-independent protein translocase protein TatA
MPGPAELIVILGVALLIFGPSKMPEIGRTVGRALREFQKIRSELMDGLDLGLDDEEPPRRRRRR